MVSVHETSRIGRSKEGAACALQGPLTEILKVDGGLRLREARRPQSAATPGNPEPRAAYGRG